MAGVIDKLVYSIGYETDDASLNKAKGGFKGLISLAKMLTTAIVGANAVLLGFTKSAASFGDSVAKTADKLGAGIIELQEYRHVADLANVSQQAFDTGMQRATRRISEAAIGTGTAKKALIELGLSATALNKMSPTAQLDAIGIAFNDVENQADRVRLAMALFDTEGVGFVNFLGLTTKELEALKQEAHDLGIVMSVEDVRAAEVAADSFTRFGRIITGIKNVIGAELFPVVIDLVDQFREWFKINKALIKQNLVMMIDLLTAAFGALWSVVRFFVSILKGVVTVFEDLGDIGKYVLGAVLLFGIIAVVGGLRNMAAMLTLLLSRFIALLIPFAKFAVAALIFEDIAVWLRGGNSALGDWIGTIEEVRLSLTNFFEALAGMIQSFKDSWINALDAVANKWNNIKSGFGITVSSLNPFAAASRRRELLSQARQGPTGNSTSNSQTNNINITGNGDNGNMIQMFENALERQNAEAFAAGNGGGL